MTIREDMLEQARVTVSTDRNASYGEPGDNFQKIADLWTGYTGQLFTAADVANMMILVKVARLRGNLSHLDSWVDVAGYAACGAEVSLR